MEEISLRFRRDSETHKHHGEISTNLGKMEDISPRSRRDLKSRKHHFKISKNLGNLAGNLFIALFLTFSASLLSSFTFLFCATVFCWSRSASSSLTMRSYRACFTSVSSGVLISLDLSSSLIFFLYALASRPYLFLTPLVNLKFGGFYLQKVFSDFIPLSTSLNCPTLCASKRAVRQHFSD